MVRILLWPLVKGEYMKVSIQLAELLRFTKTVVVELPDNYLSKCKDKYGGGDEWLEALVMGDIASEIYAQDESDDWEIDASWGAEQGTHSVIQKDILGVSPDYYVLSDGTVKRART
jgi:hypothetical protein